MAGVRHIVYVYPRDKSSAKLLHFKSNSKLDMYLRIMKCVEDVDDYLNLLDVRRAVNETKVTWRGKFETEKAVVNLTIRYR